MFESNFFYWGKKTFEWKDFWKHKNLNLKKSAKKNKKTKNEKKHD